jgi:hypothetical protein
VASCSFCRRRARDLAFESESLNACAECVVAVARFAVSAADSTVREIWRVPPPAERRATTAARAREPWEEEILADVQRELDVLAVLSLVESGRQFEAVRAASSFILNHAVPNAQVVAALFALLPLSTVGDLRDRLFPE